MTYNIRKMIIASLMVATGIVLPIAMHGIPGAAWILLPMHIPVLIAGLACGGFYGLLCGILTPFLSSILTGMPPTAILPSMVLELATYGLVAGVLSKIIKTKNKILNLYISLIIAMIAGRFMFGILNALIFSAGKYSVKEWVGSAFITCLPGIIIQILLVPIISYPLSKQINKN